MVGVLRHAVENRQIHTFSEVLGGHRCSALELAWDSIAVAFSRGGKR